MTAAITTISDGHLAHEIQEAFIAIKRATPGTPTHRAARQQWDTLKAEQVRRDTGRRLPVPGFFR